MANLQEWLPKWANWSSRLGVGPRVNRELFIIRVGCNTPARLWKSTTSSPGRVCGDNALVIESFFINIINHSLACCRHILGLRFENLKVCGTRPGSVRAVRLEYDYEHSYDLSIIIVSAFESRTGCTGIETVDINEVRKCFAHVIYKKVH